MWSIKHKIIQYLVKHLLVAITEDDVLTLTNRGYYLGKQKLTPEEVTHLKEEVNSFKESILWKLLKNEVRFMANLRMFEKGISSEQTIFGRAMLYNLEIIEKFIERCKQL